MAPIIPSESPSNFPEECGDTIGGTLEGTKVGFSCGTVAILSDSYQDDRCNDDHVVTAKEVEDSREDESEDGGEENAKRHEDVTVSDEKDGASMLVYQHQTSNLFSDENDTKFVIEEDDCIDWTTQPTQSGSPKEFVSNLMMGPSRSFEFPSINTSYNGGNDEKVSPRLSVPSPLAFFSNVRNATSSFTSVLSPTSSMGLEDIDLKPSSSGTNEKDHGKTKEKETRNGDKKMNPSKEDSVASNAAVKSSAFASGSIFGLEPFPWEIKGNRMKSNPKSSSQDTTKPASDFAALTSSMFSSSSVSSSMPKMAFSSSKLSNSLKKWGKEFNSVVNEFFNEDESKDAFVAHFGRQVSRTATRNSSFVNEQYPNAV